MSKKSSQSASSTSQPHTAIKTGGVYACLLRFIRSRRLALLVILGVFFTSTLATIALPVFTQNAAAQSASSVYVDTGVRNDVVAGAYRTALAACVLEKALAIDDPDGEGTIDATNPETIADGDWFESSKLVAVTALVDNSDEQKECRTNDLVPAMVDSFGWDTNTEAVCDLGLVERLDGSNCVTGTGNFSLAPRVTRQEMYEVIDNKRFNGEFNWTGAMLYVLYARSMEIGCRASAVGLWDDANADERSRAESSGTYWTMDVVGRDGSVKRTIYQSSDDHNRESEITTTMSPNALEPQRYSCIRLTELANEHADEYAAYVRANPPADDDPGAGDNGGETVADQTTCAVEGIGWVVCPLMVAMGTIVDASYGVVANFLEVTPVSTDTTGPLFQAWAAMRNFANVAFVIVFLIIIYSQITSFGISNYNIKKMLPRLIIAAILVNISYWVCAIAVDLSNILGMSIKDVFDNAGEQLFTTGRSLEEAGALDGQWVTIIVVVLATTAIVYAGLSVLLPFILGAIISVITAMVILALRQALIIILIVLSPLAFVAFLLPNTQSLFDRWRKMFTTLLFMFPLIAVIFGGSALAGKIITQNAGDDDWFLKALGLAVTMIPLFITVFITKALNFIGGAVGRLAGMVNDPAKGGIDRLRRGAEGYRANRQEYRKLKAMGGYRSLPGMQGSAQRRARRAAVLENRKKELSRATSGYVAETAEGDVDFRERLARGGGEGAEARALAGAINVQASLSAEEVKAEHAIIKDANLDNDIGVLQKLAKGESVNYVDKNGQERTLANRPGSSLQTAAIQRQFEIGDIGMTDGLISQSGSMGVQQRQAIAEGMAKLSGKARYYGGNAGAEVAAGNIKGPDDLNRLVADSIQGEKYSAQILANSDKDALTRISEVAATDASLGDDAKMKLMLAANEVRTDPMITNPDDRSMKRLDAIENGTKYAGP